MNELHIMAKRDAEADAPTEIVDDFDIPFSVS